MRWVSECTPFELQPAERRLLRDGVPLPLRPLTFDVLSVLVERAGHLVTKDELLQRVWDKVIVEENTLQAHISALRKALGVDAIATVSGQGYRFTLDVSSVREPAAPPTEPKDNLPQPLTSFIGREREIVEIKRWLTCTRLLTLTGAGGCGKTRLALQVAGAIRDEYADGIRLIEMAPLGVSTLIAQAVAKALAIQEQPGKDLVEVVAEWLVTRRMLLVLDNAEHLLEGCAQLADQLLRRCGQLVILVTSRERLGVDGELTYRVPSLSVPKGKNSEEVLASEAARLFVDRARLQQPDFEVTTRNAVALASICRRLDGIALAIELAAPRVRVLSIEELNRRLDDRFGVLIGGSRAALPRHRTLRSLIDWSHELLTQPEKAVLRRASVFAGGWNLGAAEQVCAGDGVDRNEMLDLLTSLADKNLVLAATQSDDTRFGLLETVRHYAHDRLRESGEEESVRAQHLACLLSIADELDEAQTDARLTGPLERLDKEHDNIRAALAWCEAAVDRSVTGLRLAGRLYWFWITRGHHSEGRHCIVRLLAVGAGCERGEAHAMALHAAGALASGQGDDVAAEAHHQDSLAIWRRLGDRRQIARSVGSLGNVAMNRDDHATARPLFEEALAITREIGDRRSIMNGLTCLGVIALEEEDLAAARAYFEEGATIGRAIGGERHPRSFLGLVHHLQGDNAMARTLLAECVEEHRALGDKDHLGDWQVWLGVVLHDEGDFAAAKVQLRDALVTLQSVGSRGVIDALESFAGLAFAIAGPIDAGRLYGAAQHRREETGNPHPAFYRDRYNSDVAAARIAMHDEAAFDRAWSEGRSWTLDDAVRYALSL